MEIVKNVAAILGVILSVASVITLCSKPIKAYMARALAKYKKEQDDETIHETLLRLESKLDSIKSDNDITVDFTREQIRGIIKDMFYTYYADKSLPLYEYKWLLKLEDLYVNRLHSNSFIKELIEEMKKWPIDYEKIRMDEEP